MDPIHRRHGNRRDTACPVFWRRFGSRFALFLAAYPWIAATVFMTVYIVRLIRWGRMPFWVPIPSVVTDFLAGQRGVPASGCFALLREIGETLMAVLLVSGVFLFPVGLIWCGLMMGAWRQGLVKGWLWIACAILGFGGTAAFVLVAWL